MFHSVPSAYPPIKDLKQLSTTSTENRETVLKLGDNEFHLVEDEGITIVGPGIVPAAKAKAKKEAKVVGWLALDSLDSYSLQSSCSLVV